jgi:hypothetical protein
MFVTPSVLRNRCASQRRGPERDSVSRSTYGFSRRMDFPKAIALATLLRVTDSRSGAVP